MNQRLYFNLLFVTRLNYRYESKIIGITGKSLYFSIKIIEPGYFFDKIGSIG
jgi:hypothetical protein